MRKILENTKIIFYTASFGLFVGACILSFYGIYLIGESLYLLLLGSHESYIVATKFVAIIDIYLISVVFYISAVGIYELFIGELNVPNWLKIETIDELKSKLASVLILVIVISFTKKLIQFENGLETLYFAVSAGITSIVLIYYYKIKEK